MHSVTLFNNFREFLLSRDHRNTPTTLVQTARNMIIGSSSIMVCRVVKKTMTSFYDYCHNNESQLCVPDYRWVDQSVILAPTRMSDYGTVYKLG